MPVIDIHHPHVHSVASTKAAVEQVARAMAAQYGVSHHWDGNSLHFTRSGINGRITVADNDVHVRVDLGFMLGAIKPMIEREIERHLDEQLA